MIDLPAKLKADSVAEALFEIRFDCAESNRIPEFVLSKLSGLPAWKSYDVTRTPLADFPFQVRLNDPNLKILPVMELKDASGRTAVKIGTHVLSFHRLPPYPGWEKFRPELDTVVDHVFGELADLMVTRLGFRYINVFDRGVHEIGAITDLNLGVSVAGKPLPAPFNLNYEVVRGAHRATVKVASSDFIKPPQKPSVSVVVDLDVYSESASHIRDATAVKAWIEEAHILEKEQFFRLFTDEMLKRLGA